MKVFAQSRMDGILVVLMLVQLALLVTGTLTARTIPVGQALALGSLVVFLICTNFQCIAHNAIHNPFFSLPSLNRLFALVNTLSIGVPFTLYRMHHLHHHKYNNDEINPATGTTKDITSTYRFGRDGLEEWIVTYVLLGFFRSGFGFMWNQAKAKGMLGAVLMESATLAAFLIVLAALDWRGFLLFYVPVWYFGHMAALAENYLEHHGAIPGDRKTDSVSAYGRLYNLVWFNNGYHQEHHWKPQVHWTKVPELREQLPPTSRRRVVRFTHWFNLFPPPRTEYREPGPASSRRSTLMEES